MKVDHLQVNDRLRALKDAWLDVTPSITIHRALAFTEVAKECWDLPANLRIAKCFRRACETAPLLIQDKELIIGNPCGAPRAGALSPDIAWEWIADEIDTISTRPQDPYYISEEDKKIMLEEIFPFWKGKSLAEACEVEMRKAGYWDYGMEAAITDLSYHVTSGGGDSSPGYDIILFKKGIDGIQKEAEEHLAALDPSDPDFAQRQAFYQASIEVCEGVRAYALRLAAYAVELAKEESDPVRKAELLEIARINAKVPAQPPQTFHEALQAVWTIESLFSLEANQCSTSLGRIDQYMYPCYKHDIDAGILTPESAFELFGCFMLKMSEVIWYTPSATAEYFAGYMPFINMSVGGIGRDGEDAVNDLTFVIMEVVRKLKMYQPTLSVRAHKNSSDEYMEKIIDVIRAGGGMPALHFDDAHVEMMRSKGYSLEDARDYAMAGCLDLQVTGRSHQNSVGMFITPMILQLAMNNGVNPNTGDDVAPHTGNFADFETYEDFYQALLTQFDWAIQLICEEHNIQLDYFRQYEQDALLSIWAYDAVRVGKPIISRKMIYENGALVNICAIQNVINSLEVIKKLVFDEKTVSAGELLEAVNTNWAGREDLRQQCLKAPKYGNNDPEVNEIARRIWHDIAELTKKTKTIYDAPMVPSGISITAYSPAGKAMLATPDGRMDFDILADGTTSPAQGTDKNGPLAVLQSAMAINQDEYMSTLLNMKFTASTLKTDADVEKLSSIIRTYLTNGGKHVQFNVVDKETLLDAQRNKEQYRDLIVRVAGYSAYFTTLTPGVQEDVISRTGHEL